MLLGRNTILLVKRMLIRVLLFRDCTFRVPELNPDNVVQSLKSQSFDQLGCYTLFCNKFKVALCLLVYISD